MGKAQRIKAERREADANVHLTRAQQKAMAREVGRQCQAMTNKFFVNEAAVILYALHEIFGFGPARLKKFYLNYYKVHHELLKFYEMSGEQDGWDVGDYLSRLQLEKIGVNLEEWEDELGVIIREEKKK